MRASRRANAVLDASAILAYLKREPGHERILEALDAEAAMSTVNLAEVLSKVVVEGQALNAVAARLGSRGLTVYPFTDDDARTVAAMYPATRSFGLSLGDRSCLALGLRLGLPVLTADRAWSHVPVGVTVEVIR